MIFMVIKDQNHQELQEVLEIIILTSIMHKIFLDTFMSKIPLMMTFSVDFSENLKQIRNHHQVLVVDLVLLIMIPFSQVDLEVEWEEVFSDHRVYSIMMISFPQTEEDLEALDHHLLVQIFIIMIWTIIQD